MKCRCGCGQTVNEGKQWIRGHHVRDGRYKLMKYQKAISDHHSFRSTVCSNCGTSHKNGSECPFCHNR